MYQRCNRHLRPQYQPCPPYFPASSTRSPSVLPSFSIQQHHHSCAFLRYFPIIQTCKEPLPATIGPAPFCYSPSRTTDPTPAFSLVRQLPVPRSSNKHPPVARLCLSLVSGLFFFIESAQPATARGLFYFDLIVLFSCATHCCIFRRFFQIFRVEARRA